jgi:hypothetical protein
VWGRHGDYPLPKLRSGQQSAKTQFFWGTQDAAGITVTLSMGCSPSSLS